MEGLDWQTLQLPLAAGMNQKADSRALQSPEFASAINVEFNKLGGLQTRKPWEEVTGSLAIVGGGTISVGDIRHCVTNGDELLLFTKEALYSRNVQASAWTLKATYLAAKVDEQPVFVTTGEQIDADRAELNGTIVFSWTETVGASSKGYVAAVDKESSGVLMAPTSLAGSAARLRVTALTTKILLTFYDGVNGLYAYALDPASPSTALAGASTTVTNTNYGQYYDIVKLPGTDTAAFVSRQNPTTSYTVGTITAGLVVTTSSKGRRCTGPIALSADPTGTYLQVVRTNSVTTNLEGDLVNASTLADVYTAQVIDAGGYSVQNIACAHRSVQNGGAYRCYVFTDSGFGAADVVRYNYVDTANNLGTAAAFLVGEIAIASRAFDRNGSVFVHITFNGTSAFVNAALQNSYFLYRDDKLLVAKLLDASAGGPSSTTSFLPNVVATGTDEYGWCGLNRRSIPLGNDYDGYADRGPVDLMITFDSNETRRCARLGKTLYIAGGEVMQYDGARLAEVGSHYYPFLFNASDSGAGTGLANGNYSYKGTYRWENAQGETERSTTASIQTITVAGGPHDVSIVDISTLTITHKTANPPSIEMWRTAVNPNDDSPFYLISDPDPTNTSATNGYLSNDNTTAALYHGSTYTDALSDTNLTDNATNPENGSVLENLAPPAATLIAASDTRLFLAGIAGAPDQVWYSKQRNDGEVAAFHDALVVTIPPEGGAITAIAIAADGTAVVFRETAIYVVLGDGLDNAGGGQNYVARCASPEYGAVSQESLAQTDDGIVFKSSKGWCLLNRAFSVSYIGGQVADYDSEDPLAVVVMKDQHQVRILTSSRMLVFFTFASQALGRPTWAEWSIDDGVHACLWRGVHVYLSSSDGLMQQRSDWTGVDYGIDVETAWIKFNDLQGFARLRRLMLLGEYRSSHQLRLRLARDYQATYFQDKTWTPSPTTVGGPLQVKHGPSIQQMQALKLRITITNTVGESARLTGLGLEVGFKRGLRPNLPAAQKQ